MAKVYRIAPEIATNVFCNIPISGYLHTMEQPLYKCGYIINDKSRLTYFNTKGLIPGVSNTFPRSKEQYKFFFYYPWSAINAAVAFNPRYYNIDEFYVIEYDIPNKILAQNIGSGYYGSIHPEFRVPIKDLVDLKRPFIKDEENIMMLKKIIANNIDVLFDENYERIFAFNESEKKKNKIENFELYKVPEKRKILLETIMKTIEPAYYSEYITGRCMTFTKEDSVNLDFENLILLYPDILNYDSLDEYCEVIRDNESRQKSFIRSRLKDRR